MAAVVGIHGIAQQFRGGYQLGTVWFDALRDGLTVAGYRAAADALAPRGLRVAYFGDLFRPPGAMAVQEPPFSSADVQPGLERALLTELYRAGVALDPSLGPPAGSMGPGRAAVQVMLERLLRSGTFAKVAQRAFIGNLKQVTRFLTDRWVKDLVLERVNEEVGEGTRVLIGHSLGSVVAYEYVCRYRPPSVGLLVTLGSPLGIPGLVFDRLTPVPVDGRGAWPGTVAGWVNVADSNDVVAMRKQLAPLFPGPSPSQAASPESPRRGRGTARGMRYVHWPRPPARWPQSALRVNQEHRERVGQLAPPGDRCEGSVGEVPGPFTPPGLARAAGRTTPSGTPARGRRP